MVQALFYRVKTKETFIKRAGLGRQRPHIVTPSGTTALQMFLKNGKWQGESLFMVPKGMRRNRCC